MWFGLAAVMVFAPLARGAVSIWSITVVEAVVLVLVFLWLLRVNNKSREYGVGSKQYEVGRIKRTKIDLAVWLFVALAAVSCFFSIYKYASVGEMLRLMTMVGVFYLVVNNFRSWMAVRLAGLIIIMAAGMSLLGLGQYFLGLDHSWWNPSEFLAATYVNHNHFAGYLEMAIPLAIGMLLVNSLRFAVYSWGKLVKPGLIAALIIMFAALVFSQSRGAWICLPVSLIVMNVVLVRRKVLKKQTLLIFLLLIALGAVFIYGGYDATARRLRTVEEINSEGFLEGRVKIWQGSIDMIKANPLYGTGIGTFVWGFPRYRPEGLGVRAYYAHNDYLQMMAEMGLLAFPLMLWMIWVVVVAGFSFRWKEVGSRQDGVGSKADFGLIDGVVLGGTVGILSLALHGLVDFNFHIPANMLIVACLAGIIMRKIQITHLPAGRQGLKQMGVE